MKNPKLVLIALLGGITAVCFFEYLAVVREKHALLDNLHKAKVELVAVQEQRQNILQELGKEEQRIRQLEDLNSRYKDILQASERRAARFSRSQGLYDDLINRVNILKLENSILRSRQDKLRRRVEQVEKESEDLKFKLASVSELKKALQALRQKAHRQAGIRIKKMPEKSVIEGNRGYLIKDGKPTYPLTVKIKVSPYSGKP